MKRTIIGAALALAFAASPAMAVTRPAHHAKHPPVASGLAIGKSSLPGKKSIAAGPANHLKFGAIGGLQPGNSNPGFVTGQVPPATTWNQSFSNKYDYAGGMLGGPLGLPAASGAAAQLYVTPGPAPTGTPPDGAVWYDSTQGLMSQQQGSTIGPLGAGGGSGGNTNITQWAGNDVGAPSAYGTAPTSGLFPSVNAFITSIPLPPGAATSALQPALNGDGGSLAHVTNFPATQPISAAALPLPTGAATAANQNATAAGTTATSAQAIQGVTGGVPVGISGTVTASFSQFAPNGNFSTPLVVGATSSRVALPSGGGATAGVYNVGASAAFVRLGSSSVVATGVEDQIAPGGFMCFAVGANVDIAAIETAGTTTLNISGGSGGCAGSGGGGGGGGSIPNPLPVTNTSLTPIVTTPANTAATQVAQTGGPWSVAQVGAVQTAVSPAISISGATTTQLIGLVSGKLIYITSWDVSAPSGTFLLEYGTGTNCSIGTTALTGAYTMVGVQVGKGDGSGIVGIVPSGNALCAVTTGSGVQFSGSMSGSQQ